jgi:acetyltransferase-like isoleucine patch superfamily enzyme
MRLAWACCMCVLPSRLRHLVGRLIFGWDIHPSAYVGRSVILVPRLTMGPGSSIGPFNVIRDIEELRLSEGASIGSRNRISGFPLASEIFKHSPARYPSLTLGRHAMITVAHEIDCSDRVELGDYSSIAGFRSTILTHSLNLVLDRFVTAPVEIGSRSAVMTGCTLLSGTRVPARSIISAGSVITTRLTHELTLYRGNPAEPVRTLPDTLGFFNRGDDHKNVVPTLAGGRRTTPRSPTFAQLGVTDPAE